MEEKNFNFDPFTGQPINNNNQNQANNQYNQYQNCQNNGKQYYNYNCDNCQERAIRKSIKSIIWLVIVIIYFLVSFTTGAWHITWLIFLVGACFSSISNLVVNLARKQQ